MANRQQFQSTLPAWGATSTWGASSGGTYISIHAPRMGSDNLDADSKRIAQISIHAPRMGSDARQDHCLLQHPISIHAPRMGSD